ncbi:hypothetical protein [Streptomyces hydrogenans]|uniref:hypothetical protein n=1 Tax=Streptomyces hydrogenans TaxID=1873719 RepID=UPI0038107291
MGLLLADPASPRSLTGQAREAGWRIDPDTKETCPACVIGDMVALSLAGQRGGGGPVLERGECPSCSGRTISVAEGERCHYCRRFTPYPPDSWDAPDGDAPGC